MASRARLLASLKGLLCVYKPVDMNMGYLKKNIINRIISEANDICGLPPIKTIDIPQIEEADSGALLVVGLRKQKDYNEHPLVVGSPFLANDLIFNELYPMETTSSGVCLFGLNLDSNQLLKLKENAWASSYRLEGVLGRKTRENLIKGRVIETTAYEEVSRGRALKILAKINSNFRRLSFELSGVDPQSEEMYEMARRGIPRPAIPGQLLISALELAFWRPPYFAIELSSTGETDLSLRNFVGEFGAALGTVASPARLTRQGFGPFLAEHTLLPKQINLQNVIQNISLSRQLVEMYMKKQSLTFESMSLPEIKREVIDAIGMRSEKEEEDDAMRPYWKRHY